MKILMPLILAILFISCSKESFEQKLTGTWELRASYGSPPQVYTDHPPGNGIKLTFTLDSLTFHNANSPYPSQTHPYWIEKDTMLNLDGFDKVIYYGKDTSGRYHFEIANNKLTLLSAGIEHGYGEFLRIK